MKGPSEFKLGFKAATTILANTKGSIITTGVGKSGHIARKVSSTMLSLGIPSFYVHPTEAQHGDLGAIRTADAVLAFSHSGASVELTSILCHCDWLTVPVVAVTSEAVSILGKAARAVVAYPKVEEAAFMAPTTSSTQQLVIGDMLAVAIAECRGITPEQFHRNHPGGAIGKGVADG